MVGIPGTSYQLPGQGHRQCRQRRGSWVEAGPVEVNAVTKYYTFGGSRVAMRQGNVVYYLNGDHLGSTSLTTDINGEVVSEVRYVPYGEERWSNGASVTDFGFTSQRSEASFGLMDYNTRYYLGWGGLLVPTVSCRSQQARPGLIGTGIRGIIR